MNWEIWGPPLGVLGLSVVAGVLFLLKTLKVTPVQTQNVGESQGDLQALKAQLLEALRELDADRQKMSEEEWSSRREVLLQEAEEVLQAMETQASDIDAVGEAAESQNQNELPAKVVWGYLVISVVFFAILGVLLGQYARPRAEGEIMTGAKEQTTMAALSAARDARQIDAQNALKENPEDLDALGVLAYDALLIRDFSSAMGYLETARGHGPDVPQIQLCLGILQMSVGMGNRAKESFESALAPNSDWPRALLWRAVLRSNLGENETALIDLQKAMPGLELLEEQQFAQGLLAELNKPPPILMGEVVLNGLVEGASEPKGVLFVIVRRSAAGGGPPVAVQRIAGASFPAAFALGKSDMVMGGVWPEEVYVMARLDSDGNAMTHEDSDLESPVLGPITGEKASLSLTLNVNEQSPQAEPSLSETVTKEETATGMGISGRILLSESVDTPTSGVVFIVARRSKEGGGPPVAAKKVTSPRFPMAFRLNSEDLMMGGEWPKEVWVEARLDADGNAMTKEQGDVASERLGPLLAGADSIQLVIGTGQ